MKKFFITILFLALLSHLYAQEYQANWNSLNTREIPSWFHKDKFGIFIHWGLYSVPAYAPVLPNSGYNYAEWYWRRIRRDYFQGKEENEASRQLFTEFHNKNYGQDFKYEQFESLFKAELFKPQQWARLFKASGAKYIILTSKHHEGYTLWDSPEADRSWGRPWNAVTGTPKRDLLGALTAAVRSQGLKMGFYYSLYEWFNPLWVTDKQKYVTEHMIPQFKDLVNRYKPSIIFADGEWELPDSGWHSPQLLAWLFNQSPVKNEVVVNDRWGSNTRKLNKGAMYTTSEYGSGMNKSVIWEQCEGIGHSFGYNRNEALEDYKTDSDLILMLADVVSRGGNLLLDIGPTSDGRIPVIMQQRLMAIGNWLKVNGEAIYGTEVYNHPYQWSKGIIPETKQGHYMTAYNVAELIKPKKDTANIEAFFTNKGKALNCSLPHFQSTINIQGLNLNQNTRIHLLGSTKEVQFQNGPDGCLISLKNIAPNDLPYKIFTLKIANALP